MTRLRPLQILVLLLYHEGTFGQEQTSFDSIKTYRLDDIVITASRLEEDLSKSPVSIEKLSGKTIHQLPVKTDWSFLQVSIIGPISLFPTETIL